MVETLAGGGVGRTSAVAFSGPYGLAADGRGTVFVAGLSVCLARCLQPTSLICLRGLFCELQICTITAFVLSIGKHEWLQRFNSTVTVLETPLPSINPLHSRTLRMKTL